MTLTLSVIRLLNSIASLSPKSAVRSLVSLSRSRTRTQFFETLMVPGAERRL